MNFSRLFQRGGPEKPGDAQAESAEHLAPADYFTAERTADLGRALGNLRTVKINGIYRVD